MMNITFMVILTFIFTMLFIFWRPKGINEAIPSTIGALIVILTGVISMGNILDISSKVSGAAITIISTMVMAIVLESFGFFYWVTAILANRAKGSGLRLFWLTNLLCFLMTIFFNNDGSILITTPILALLFRNLQFKNHQKLPYLISGALIATASSAPIGVSNIVNLIALNIIHMDLYQQTAMMFVPGNLGLLFMSIMLYAVFRKHIPKRLPELTLSYDFKDKPAHPLQSDPLPSENKQRKTVMIWMLIFVFSMRIGLFVASYIGIPIEYVAVTGSLLLLFWRWFYLKISPSDMLRKTPWYIFIFAFTMYILIYGLNNIGFTNFLVEQFEPLIKGSLFNASVVMGGLLMVLSNLFNNHPALMIGTLTLTHMGLDPITVKTVYLANIIGSDIGSLLLPIGTLATLIWMHILKREKVKISWLTYFKTTIIVIPPTVIFTLLTLYVWIELVFNGKSL